MTRSPSSTSRRTVALAAALCTAISAISVGVAAAQTTAPAPVTTTDVTSAAEKALIDAVPAQTLTWTPCADSTSVECTTLKVPLTWEKPAGEQIELKMVRRKAGEVSVGPLVIQMGSALNNTSSFAQEAEEFVSPQLIKRFDVVGLQNRAQLTKPALRCFSTFAESEFVVKGIQGPPQSAPEWAKAADAAGMLGEGCSTQGKDLAQTYSTWSLVRDHEVMRRALGADVKLNFYTAIYGSAMAQAYASVYPDRVRATALDSPYDAKSFFGANQPRTQSEAIQRGAALHNVLSSLIERCEKAGVTHCSFAGSGKGSTWKKLEFLMNSLKTAPIKLAQGQVLGYVEFLYAFEMYLQDHTGMTALMDGAQEAYTVAMGTRASRGGSLQTLADAVTRRTAATRQGGDEYDNTYDSYYAYLCNDHSVALTKDQIPGEHRKLEKRFPFVGPRFLYEELPCTSDTWKVTPSTPFAGTFGKKLALPPLVISSSFNPFSHPTQAQRITSAFPGAGVVKGDGVWGIGLHRTPNGCMDQSIDTYMIDGKLPAGGVATCTATWQPFDGSTQPAPPAPRTLLEGGVALNRRR